MIIVEKDILLARGNVYDFYTLEWKTEKCNNFPWKYNTSFLKYYLVRYYFINAELWLSTCSTT